MNTYECLLKLLKEISLRNSLSGSCCLSSIKRTAPHIMPPWKRTAECAEVKKKKKEEMRLQQSESSWQDSSLSAALWFRSSFSAWYHREEVSQLELFSQLLSPAGIQDDFLLCRFSQTQKPLHNEPKSQPLFPQHGRAAENSWLFRRTGRNMFLAKCNTSAVSQKAEADNWKIATDGMLLPCLVRGQLVRQRQKARCVTGAHPPPRSADWIRQKS